MKRLPGTSGVGAWRIVLTNSKNADEYDHNANAISRQARITHEIPDLLSLRVLELTRLHKDPCTQDEVNDFLRFAVTFGVVRKETESHNASPLRPTMPTSPNVPTPDRTTRPRS